MKEIKRRKEDLKLKITKTKVKKEEERKVIRGAKNEEEKNVQFWINTTRKKPGFLSFI